MGEKYIPNRKFLGLPAVSENYFDKRYKHNVIFDTTEVSKGIGDWLENGPLGRWGWHYTRKELERGIAPKDTVVVSFEKGEDAFLCEMKK